MDNNALDTENDKWYKRMWNQHTTWFMVFAVIVSVVAWIMMSRANDSLKDRNDRIVAAYQQRSHATDSLVASYRKLLSDSTITPITAMSLNQGLVQASERLASEETDQEIKHLLELELARIQHEYEVLNLWCALLTIVFLIFSFFSIFKTNEMTRQGEEALMRLGETAREAKEKSDSIDEKVTKAEARVTAKTEQLSSKAQEKFNKLETDINSANTKLSELSGSIDTANESLKKLTDRFGEIQPQFDAIIQQKVLTFDQYVETNLGEEKRKFFSEIKATVEHLDQEVTLLKNSRGAAEESGDASIPDTPAKEEEEEDEDNPENE